MTMREWNLLADIGGTNARFALAETHSRVIQKAENYTVFEYAQLSDTLNDYIGKIRLSGSWQALPSSACFALAGPVSEGGFRFTNNGWQIDSSVSSLLGETPMEIINDFHAIGYAVPHLESQDLIEVCAGTAKDDEPIVIVGPGTGLGVCTVVPTTVGYRVLPGEGGHVDFSPVDKADVLVFERLREKYGRVSAERILSGVGIETIYGVLASIANIKPSLRTASEISSAAISQSDPIAVATLQMFCRCLGTFAGNLALTLGAHGGVYIAGGIVPRIENFFIHSGFEEQFLSKGRVSKYLSKVPVWLITKADVGLLGAMHKINCTANSHCDPQAR